MKTEIELTLVTRAKKGREQCNIHSIDSKMPTKLLLFI